MNLKLSNDTYNKLKWLAQIGIPAAATLYFALATLWGLPDTEQVMGSLAALDAFLGAVLGLSTSAYNSSDVRFDGVLNITSNENDGAGKTFSLDLIGEPEDLANKAEIRFKVMPQ